MHYFNDDTILYLNGTFAKAIDSKIDLYSQSLHYGYSVFEGIRAYKNIDSKSKIFRAEAHFDRLKNSAEAINMPYSFNNTELIEATYKLLEMNSLGDAYIRPLVYAPANMTYAFNKESYITIQVWEMQPFLGDKLLRIYSSSFQRPNPNGFKIHAKAGGHYVNSIIASQDAKMKGFDEALLQDMDGNVAEGPGANVFMEKDGKFYTPSLGHILPGITRATVLEIIKDFNLSCEEKKITHDELKSADHVFFCGTAVEVLGWQSLDDHSFTKPWAESNSNKIEKAYKALVRDDLLTYNQIKSTIKK